MLRVIDLDIEGTLTGDTRVAEIALVEMPAIEQDFIYFEKQEFESHSSKMKTYLDDLEQIVKTSGELLEGNAFYYHATLKLFPALYNKQVNLFWCGKQANTRICEIGFNAGHSSMLMLLGREKTPLNYTIFDIGHHQYTKPCLDYITTNFTHVNFEYVEGDSTLIMPEWINNHKDLIGTYDVVHVDGGHTKHCISNDIKNTDLLVKVGGIVIIDDTYIPYINDCVNDYISSGNYIELNLCATVGYAHRIIKKIK